MVVQNEDIEKTCCFYVSEFHLEMILVPYINKKIEENISIMTEKNLRNTVEILMSKMNLEENNKRKILELDWEGKEEVKDKSNIIIIGSKEYIENKNKNLGQSAVSVLHCYDFEEEKNDFNNIIKKYPKTLNTLGEKNLGK